MRTAASARAADQSSNDHALAATYARIDAQNAHRTAAFNQKMQSDQSGSAAPAASNLPSAAAIPGMTCSGSDVSQTCDAQ